MKKTVLTVVAALLVFPLLGLTQGTMLSVSVEIPFEFYIGTELMPAGTYSFKPNKAVGVIDVMNTANARTVMASVLTRIAMWPDHDTHVVFDRAGDRYYLAELHVAGADGYHFKGAPGPHTHVSLKGK